MKAYLLSILGVIIAGIVIDVVIPSGEINKYIKNIFSIFVVFVIISPVVSFLVEKKDFSINTTSVEMNDKLLNYIDSMKIQDMEKEIITTLNENGFKNIDIKIKFKRENNEIVYISCEVNLENLVISEDKQHINKYEFIRGVVGEKTNLTDEEIIFYG